MTDSTLPTGGFASTPSDLVTLAEYVPCGGCRGGLCRSCAMIARFVEDEIRRRQGEWKAADKRKRWCEGAVTALMAVTFFGSFPYVGLWAFPLTFAVVYAAMWLANLDDAVPRALAEAEKRQRDAAHASNELHRRLADVGIDRWAGQR